MAESASNLYSAAQAQFRTAEAAVHACDEDGGAAERMFSEKLVKLELTVRQVTDSIALGEKWVGSQEDILEKLEKDVNDASAACLERKRVLQLHISASAPTREFSALGNAIIECTAAINQAPG